MDANNQQFTELLNKTDSAFQKLLDNPGSSEFTHAYESAKQELDYYISHMRDELRKKYQNY